MVLGTTASSSFLASGTVIASNPETHDAWVLTAAHVVKGATSLTFTIDDGTESVTYAAIGWVANSKFNNGNLLAGNDIGLIHLGSEVGVTPSTLYKGTAEQGRLGISAGYGMTGKGSEGYVTDWSNIRKRAGENRVDEFYPVRRGAPNVIMMDFDSPDGSSSHYGSAWPEDLEYLIAPGDSGGGLFAVIEGVNQLIGVHSFIGSFDGATDAGYGDVSGDTRVSRYIDWINGAMTGGKHGGKGGGGKGGAPGQTYVEGDYEFAFLEVSPVPEPAALISLCAAVPILLRRRRKSR